MSENHKIEIWDIDKVVPYEKNAKLHSDEQVQKLATAILTYGWTQPIVVDKDGVIIAGHGRRLAAIKLGRKKVPVICRRDLNKAQADALRLADNRVASTEYDMSLIQEELQRLVNDDIDLSTLGFDQKEIEFSISDLGEIDASMFVEDVSTAVEEQKKETKAIAEQIDDTAAPVTDALGFKRVTIQQSRVIRQLMTQTEQKMGKKGADALIAALSAAAQ